MGQVFFVISVILVLALAFACWLIYTPSGKKKLRQLAPALSVMSTTVTDISEDKLKMVSRVKLTNPLPFNLQTKAIQYSIFIDSVKVIKSDYNKSLKIHSSDSATIEVPIEVLKKSIKRVLKYFDEQKKDSANYTVKAQLNLEIPIAGKKQFEFVKSMQLPAIRLLKAQLQKLNIEKLGLKQSNLEMILHIDNPNVFPIKVKDGKYSVIIDTDDMKMDGRLQNTVIIPAKRPADVSMNLDIKTLKVGKLGWKMLFDKKDTQIKFTFKCKLESDNKILDNSTMVMNMNATLDELKKLKS